MSGPGPANRLLPNRVLVRGGREPGQTAVRMQRFLDAWLVCDWQLNVAGEKEEGGANESGVCLKHNNSVRATSMERS